MCQDTSAYTSAGYWSSISFTWIAPFIARAARKVPKGEDTLEERDADGLFPEDLSSEVLSRHFSLYYDQRTDTREQGKDLRAEREGSGLAGWLRRGLRGVRTQGHLLRTLLVLHAPRFAWHTVLALLTCTVRLVSPLVLRAFLIWLTQSDTSDTSQVWRGYMLAVALGACAFAVACVQHQQPWCGTLLGFVCRQQTISAVHSKLLRLNAAAVSAISPGLIINLVSNDVRRFEDACLYWIYLWEAPLELGLVMLMVSLQLDWLAALAGVSTAFLLVPMQALLIRPVARIRRDTALATDARVRLTSEAIQGALACKVLGWEEPLSQELRTLRAKEAKHIGQLSSIRATNMAVQFFITTLVTFVTFSVYWARHGSLNIAEVFYILSLLQLPRRSMGSFMQAIQVLTELSVSLQRIQRFLSAYEPPLPLTSTRASPPTPSLTHPPTHTTSHTGTADKPHSGKADSLDMSPVPVTASHNEGSTRGSCAYSGLERGTVVMTGASYDWSRPFGGKGPEQVYGLGVLDGSVRGGKGKSEKPTGNKGGKTDKTGTSSDASKIHTNNNPHTVVSLPTNANPISNHTTAHTVPAETSTTAGTSTSRPTSLDAQPYITLCGVRLALQPGELLGVCGEAGAGKSSLLCALLGELQPLDTSSQDLLCVRGCERGAWEQDTLTRVDKSNLGSCAVVGTLAYCAQVPWVVAGTVRDNILFGSAYDSAWYKRVVRVCALEEDISRLVAGDQTELGERGINLSGGQKARLALARAAYRRPDVCLLDDPLSAVDPRVGRTLFRDCIGHKGCMKDSTRILVTHQRQFLPLCDRVLVLRGGRPVALAPWDTLVDMNLPEIVSAVTGGLSLEDAHSDGASDTSDTEPDTYTHAHSGLIRAQPEPSPHPDTHTRTSPVHPPTPFTRPNANTHDTLADTDTESEPRAGDNNTRRPTLTHTQSWRHQPLAWMRSFGPHMSFAMGGGGWPGGSLRRVFSSRRFLTEESATETDTENTAMGGACGGNDNTHDNTHGAGTGPLRSERTMAPTVANGAASAAGLSTHGDGGGGGGAHKRGVLAAGVQQDAAGVAATAAGELVASEGRALGDVQWRVYGEYFVQMGWVAVVSLPVIILVAQACYLASEWWLSMWAKASPQSQAEDKWLWVYGLLTGLVVCFGLTRAFYFFHVSLRASTRVHDAMVSRLLRAPLAFFHTNPAGRVLNRFSKDQSSVDDQLPTVMFDALQCGLLVLGALVLVSAAVPYVLPIFVPLGFLFHWIRTRYLSASREVKRWEAVTRSPVYATFSSTLKGLATIRAYGVQDRFHRELLVDLTRNGAWTFAFSATGRWIGFRLDMVAAVTMLSAALISVAARENVSPALLGLALSNLLQMIFVVQWFVRQSAEVENNMTCMERMLEYTRLPQEPPRVCEGGGEPPAHWPRTGALVWECVCARYRPGLPLVLQDISFSLRPGSVCGVVGRTGSGKSSLALTMFRLIEVTSGRVCLDGVDVACVGVDALRAQLAIIPQDPVLFSGTVRSNLDPWCRHDDNELWRVLDKVQMRKSISLMGGLSSHLAEAGDNLSVGQRQLFCLARALLQSARVLVLDEATANVDRETDALIHSALDSYVQPQLHTQTPGHTHTEDTGGRVLLVIAHRIDSIMDSDHLLVLGSGRLLEQGCPSDLVAREGGVFSGMVTAARLATEANKTDRETQAEAKDA